MARLFLLLATLGALALGRPEDVNAQQHVLTHDGSAPNRPFPNPAEEVRKELQLAEIIPTVIDDFTPSLALKVKWPSKKRAHLGNTIKPEKLQDPPSVSLHDFRTTSDLCTSKATYVITLTDPDAPSRHDPKWAEFCHWIASGALKPDAAGRAGGASEDPDGCVQRLSDLDEVMPYKPPAPPAKTGKHRYVFLAFVPANGTTERLHLSKPSDRQHWGYDTEEGETKGVREWAGENGLIPVAANFIFAKHKKQ
ncbi:hypothetical protein VTK56DRAFT_8183 [Thermocarpiscus australiensis]